MKMTFAALLVLFSYFALATARSRQFRMPASTADKIELENQIKASVFQLVRQLCKTNTRENCKFHKPQVVLKEVSSDSLHIEYEAQMDHVMAEDTPPLDTYTAQVKDGRIVKIEVKSLINY